MSPQKYLSNNNDYSRRFEDIIILPLTIIISSRTIILTLLRFHVMPNKGAR